MRNLLFLFLLFSGSAKAQVLYGGIQKSTLHDILKPVGGTLVITDTQTVNSWLRQAAQEPTLFYDSATSKINIYFTGGKDSLGVNSYNDKMGLVTSTDMVTFSSPIKVIGQGYGGATTNRRATSSWVGKQGNRYFLLALNGFGIGWPGEDRNIYGYTSLDGVNWIDAGIKIDKATAFPGHAMMGFGNIGVCVDEKNNPVVIGGKYLSLVEASNGTTWSIWRATADSLMGTWTLADSLSSLQVRGTGMYGGPQLIYKNGTYYAFYHYGTSGNLPTLLAYATSTDCINWTVKETPFVPFDIKPYGVLTDQIADPYFTEINGKVYMLAEYCQNTGAGSYRSSIYLWTFDGTFQQMLNYLY